MKLMGDFAPSSIKECEIKNYFGRKVAIDASMSLYQFLIAVRSDGNMLTDDDGETTSHLVGLFYRTIRFIDTWLAANSDLPLPIPPPLCLFPAILHLPRHFTMASFPRHLKYS